MVATFCLRLAAGLIASLVLLDPKPIPPRFFRVHYLTALGLLAVAAFFLRERAEPLLGMVLILGLILCAAGSIIWHVDEAPGGRALNLMAAGVMVATLVLASRVLHGDSVSSWALLDDFASAAMLGTTTTAMLMGHSYLISPAMTITPLVRLLRAVGVALVFRIGLACVGLWQWTAEHSLANLDTETLLWIGARWLLGLVILLALGWMAWETARIRSTQSATGILYVAVVVCFLGELTSLLLLEKTGSIL